MPHDQHADLGEPADSFTTITLVARVCNRTKVPASADTRQPRHIHRYTERWSIQLRHLQETTPLRHSFCLFYVNNRSAHSQKNIWENELLADPNNNVHVLIVTFDKTGIATGHVSRLPHQVIAGNPNFSFQALISAF